MRYLRYCLAPWNITNATHSSTPPTLGHRPPYPRRHTTHIAHSGKSTKLACHARKHVIHSSLPPTQARHPRNYVTNVTHASKQLTPCSDHRISKYWHKKNGKVEKCKNYSMSKQTFLW